MGRVRRVLAAVGVAAFVVACLRLGWWQLERYHSPSGSLQNLGYTLQWPTFAAFALFMAWRLSRLERRRRQRAAADDTGASSADAAGPQTPPAPAVSVPDQLDVAEKRRAERPNRFSSGTGDEEEPDDELAAYNRYLAELNARPPNA